MSCPDENTLCAFAERALESAEHARVEEHLDGCTSCLVHLSDIAHAMAGSKGPEDAEDDPTVALQRGSKVGRYAVVDILGQGGMGTVYLAHDTQIDRRVALKVLRDGHLRPESRARMMREARLMARIGHPNIVTVFDAGEADGQMYIAMELIEGQTLASWLQAEARSFEDILGAFDFAGRALVAAHAAGVVHRDFKPENVLVDRAGRVAVSDFGIATASDLVAARETGSYSGGDDGGALTHTGAVLGTPLYMSPEQYAGEPIGPASDQFSFAVAFYRAVFDQAPFAGASLIERRRAVLAHDLSPLADERRRRAPPRVYPALVRALARDPAARFATLEGLLDTLKSGSTPPAPRHGRRLVRLLRPVPLLVTCAIVIASALTTVRLAARRRSPITLADAEAGSRPDAAVTLAREHGRRTAVVPLKAKNESGDPRFDGVVPCVLGELLSSSRRLDPYPTTGLRSLALAFDPSAEGTDEELARILHDKDDIPVVTVQTSVARAGAATVLTLAAKDVAGGTTVCDLREEARSEPEVILAMRRLATRLREALGDPPAASEIEPSLSSSLDALHEYALGEESVAVSDVAGAVVHLRRAVSIDDGFAEAHAALGVHFYNLQELRAAATETELALRDPAHLTERRRLTLLAESHEEQGRIAESIGVSEQLLVLWPGDIRTEIGVSATALSAGDWTLGLDLARRAVADHPLVLVSQQNLLLALVANEQFAEAEREGRALLDSAARATRFSYAFLMIAQALLGETDRALETTARLAEVDAEFADECRADLAMYQGHLDEAEALLRGRIALAMARGDAISVRTELDVLAQSLLRRGDRAGATAAARAVVGGGSDMLDYRVANTLLRAGHEEQARKLAHEWSDDPAPEARGYAKMLEGDLLVRRGQARQAMDKYRAALKFRDSWVAHQRLGAAARVARDWDTAEAELTLCLARRGEAAVAQTPSLHLLIPVQDELALARQHLATPSLP